ncbi:MAG: restriction endonuclease subunit R, partial [Symploca sp. SIO3E6]|nr:restriction endonuclease subunit R [Caldora sp. SIO3E6]
IETKNSTVNALEGLPQLLTYAYRRLEEQSGIWGLTTNGLNYQFVYIQPGNPPTYQLFPELSLIRPEQSMQLLQVLKAIALEGVRC